MNYWIEHCEQPRPRPADVDWDVFISYRSVNRIWAVALYDMLTQCKYKIFLDQYVLVPGQGLASQLGKNLQRSASGVLIWSLNTADSEWVENEFDAMVARKNDTAKEEFPFFFVVASLDGQKPPGLQGGQLYLDFKDYPDGPMGADLVRLTCGLQGKPLSSPAVSRVVQFEAAMREEPASLRAMATAGLYDRILQRVESEDLAYTTSATLSAVAVDLLIRGKKYPEALKALEIALKRFPNSLRLRQLQGLGLRRSGKLDDAAYEMNLLLEKGHRDTETLGILASVWADLWQRRLEGGDTHSARDALERSRNCYKEGFTKVPTDTYTGINAASKSALLGETDEAQALAEQVLERLREIAQKRNGTPSPDYWERVTEPEALLLKGDWDRAVELYHAARIAHQNEKGSIESTGIQVARLLRVLPVPETIRQKLIAEFNLSL
jgi:tetratricopeptide (TPR) repeat protein